MTRNEENQKGFSKMYVHRNEIGRLVELCKGRGLKVNANKYKYWYVDSLLMIGNLSIYPS